MTETQPGLRTYFAPAERATEQELNSAIRTVAEHPLLQAVLEAFTGATLVLNRQRQIIAANQGALSTFNSEVVDSVLGRRPGEALGCVNAWKNEGGCGTSKNCSKCGAVRSILESQKTSKPVEKECFLTLSSGAPRASLELKVRTQSISVDGNQFSVFTLQDISERKQKEALERVFYHDVLNTITAIANTSALLRRLGAGQLDRLTDLIGKLAQRLIREICEQRDRSLQEQGEIEVHPAPVAVRDIVEELQHLFEIYAMNRNIRLVVDSTGADETLITDRALLGRVLGNMLKNAVEATAEEAEVRLSCERRPDGILFKVWNREMIPEEISARIFERHFSTKSTTGRGLGTYSMKLLGEKHLGGQVGFESSEAAGTTFWISLPSVTENQTVTDTDSAAASEKMTHF